MIKKNAAAVLSKTSTTQCTYKNKSAPNLVIHFLRLNIQYEHIFIPYLRKVRIRLKTKG